MNDFSKTASDLFMQGYSCSESVINAAYNAGVIDKSLNPELINRIASPFSGAMGGHQCLCGAVASSQIILGLVYGRTSPNNDPHKIKELANEFNEEFKKKRKATCCKVLRLAQKDFPENPRQSCANIVQECAEILTAIIERSGSKI